MSFKEVKELRKSGKLDEALKLALKELEKEPNNIWNKRSLAWVYYTYLKEFSTPNKYESFIDYLEKIKKLELPESEKMVFDNCAFQIGKIIYSLNKIDTIDYLKIDRLFECVKEFHFTKPSESFSYLFKAFLKGSERWNKYTEFADWWNYEHFRKEDYLSEEFNNKKIISLVERAHIAYAKKILEGKRSLVNTSLGQIEKKNVVDKDKIESFLSKLDIIIDGHPEFIYLPYYKAKLLLACGDKKDAMNAFLPFAKIKKNEFWTWELLSEVYPAGDEKKIACLCKALCLNSPEDYLVNTRLKMAKEFIRIEKNNEAKTEIKKIIDIRLANEWKIPGIIQQWTEESWYKNAKNQENNQLFYQQYISTAEEILFMDIPEEIVLVEYVNYNKNIINFIIDKNKNGFFKYPKLKTKPQIGDTYKIRFDGKGKELFYKIHTIKKVTEPISHPALKSFEGEIYIKEEANFGFVDGVFISPEIILKQNLKNNQFIKGKSILSFNKKRQEWGWKAINIEV